MTESIAKTAATQTQVSDIAAQIIEETVRRCQELPEYAGRPAWEQVIRDVIQKHLVAMLAMERERVIPDGWALVPIEPTLAWFEQAFPTPPRAHERAGAMRVHEHAQKMRMDEYRILISRAPEPEGGEQP